MEDKVGLTLACLNIKKLVKMMTGKTYNFTQISQYYWFMGELGKNIKKTDIKNDVCLHSDLTSLVRFLFYLYSSLIVMIAHHQSFSCSTLAKPLCFRYN